MKNFINNFQATLESHAYHNYLTVNQVMSALYRAIDETTKNGILRVLSPEDNQLYIEAVHDRHEAYEYQQRYSDEQVEEELARLSAANTVDTDHIKATPSTIETIANEYQIAWRTKQVYTCVVKGRLCEIDVAGHSLSDIHKGYVWRIDTIGKEAFATLSYAEKLANLVAIIQVNQHNI